MVLEHASLQSKCVYTYTAHVRPWWYTAHIRPWWYTAHVRPWWYTAHVRQAVVVHCTRTSGRGGTLHTYVRPWWYTVHVRPWWYTAHVRQAVVVHCCTCDCVVKKLIVSSDACNPAVEPYMKAHRATLIVRVSWIICLL